MTKFNIWEKVIVTSVSNWAIATIQNIDMFSVWLEPTYTGEPRYFINNHIFNESELLKAN